MAWSATHARDQPALPPHGAATPDQSVAITADRGDIGVRVDRVLLRHLGHVPGVSRNRLQRLIESGAVQVNGRIVSRASARVAAGDRISVTLPARRPRAAPAAEPLPLAILHEDDYLLVVNKPAGQVAHPAFRNTSGTLLNALLAYAGGRWTPALLSRLDKGTSGVVLVAKCKAAHTALQRSGERNEIEKDYLAIVAGRPPRRGSIDLALDRDPWDRRRVTVRDRGGVPSVTRFERLQSAQVAPGRWRSLLRCRLVTGRMHQIRVHLAAKGWPIVGDPVYRARMPRSLPRPGEPAEPTLRRQALHAWRLAFTHPVSAARIEVTAPIPADLQPLVDDIYASTRAIDSATVPSAE